MKILTKTLLSIFLSTGLMTACYANDDYGIHNFIPEGYDLIETYQGDLNKDGLADVVLLVQDTNPDLIAPDEYDLKIIDKNPQGIMILFQSGETDTGYELIAQNLDGFSFGGTEYPPELMFEIKNNKLTIEYLHGRYGSWHYLLCYDGQNDFDLIGFDKSSRNGPIPETLYSINFLTKKMKKLENPDLTNYDYDEKEFKETWKKIDFDKLLKLSEINDFRRIEKIGKIYQ